MGDIVSVFVSGDFNATYRFRPIILVFAALLAGVIASKASAAPQEVGGQSNDALDHVEQGGGAPTSLAILIEEAERGDPAIRSAETAASAAALAAPQVASLPDAQVTLQQFSVGSPRPFAGYTNSDFAYIGAGISQQLPYPGKLKLRGEVADRDAATAKAHIDVVRNDEIEKLKLAYFQLAYLQQSLTLLQQNDALLQQVAQEATAHYSSGMGNQQDVLRAQLERTKILRDISMHHRLAGQTEAEIKRILRRNQDSPDIIAEPLSATFLRYTASELLGKVEAQNPNLAEDSTMIQRNQVAVEAAQKEFRPDFQLSYMFEQPDPKFRDYFMLSVSMNLPRRKPRQAALAQARVNVERTRQDRDADLQNALAEVQKQYVTAKTAEEQLLIDRDGLIPQAQATIQAALAAYQSNRADFESVLSSVSDVLNLNLEYQQTLLDHETALVQLERLTGETLR